MTRQESIKAAVAKAWGNAFENDPNWSDGYTLEDIAGDMIAYCDDVADFALDGDGPDGTDYRGLEKELIVILQEITGRTA